MTTKKKERAETTVEHIRKADPDAVYIGRGVDPRTGHRLYSRRWGNPFPLKENGPALCMKKYLAYLKANPELVALAKRELKGKQLACWCPQPGPCHGWVLAALANGKTIDEVIADWKESGLLAHQEELFGG